MRWLVEVVTLGKTETESLHVDAESWQKALQAARAQRGEAAPMSGFSIELLDDGCRAIDPMSRLRYEVRRQPEQTASGAPRAPSVRPPSDGTSAPAPARGRDSTAAPVAVERPPVERPSTEVPRPVSQPAHAKRPSLSANALAAVIGPSATAGVEAAATPAPSAASPPIAPAPAPVARVTPSIPPSAPRPDVGLHIPSQVIFKREHDATESVPLTYREYVFHVPSGTSEQGAEALLQTQLELVLASLARVPAGKLVNLAAFDVAFHGRPPVPPLATLMWKDWRGAPLVEFPRRPGYTPQASAPPPALIAQPLIPVGPAAVDPPPAAEQPRSVSQPPAPNVVPAAAPVPVAPPPAPAIALAPILSALTAPVAVEAPADADGLAGAVAVGPAVASLHAPVPAPAPQPRSRVRGEDLIADLFESMHELHFLRDAVEGGNFCLTLAMEKIPSQAGIVHLYDIDRREFLITNTRGVAASTLLLRRHTEGDLLLSAAMGKRRAVVIADAAQSEAASLERYVALGGAQSLIVAPVMQSGRFLGAIELLNPLDGQPYTEAEGNALTYIAEQFAEFVASRGVVTDPERISSRVG
jgi:GAF domain-containing protein